MIYFLIAVILMLLLGLRAQMDAQQMNRDSWSVEPWGCDLEKACQLTWEEVYPTRRRWAELEPETREEWKLVCGKFYGHVVKLNGLKEVDHVSN